ncbi:hypothetical protein [Paracoccus sp. (in: a-proteobacteria)]|uniref:hypothetical protein n=1 Tax=Paracoccus sp. TaxID=267 RepID=UPI00396C4780
MSGRPAVPAYVGLVADTHLPRAAHPVVVPAAGSHGGATAEGQRALLAKLGIAEDSIGCPIESSMDSVEVGVLDNGRSVQVDRLAVSSCQTA